MITRSMVDSPGAKLTRGAAGRQDAPKRTSLGPIEVNTSARVSQPPTGPPVGEGERVRELFQSVSLYYVHKVEILYKMQNQMNMSYTYGKARELFKMDDEQSANGLPLGPFYAVPRCIDSLVVGTFAAVLGGVQQLLIERAASRFGVGRGVVKPWRTLDQGARHAIRSARFLTAVTALSDSHVRLSGDRRGDMLWQDFVPTMPTVEVVFDNAAFHVSCGKGLRKDWLEACRLHSPGNALTREMLRSPSSPDHFADQGVPIIKWTMAKLCDDVLVATGMDLRAEWPMKIPAWQDANLEFQSNLLYGRVVVVARIISDKKANRHSAQSTKIQGATI